MMVMIATLTAIETAAAANVDTGIRGQVLAAAAMAFVTLMGVAVVWARARIETATLIARAEALEAQARLAKAEAATRAVVTGVDSARVDVAAVLAAAAPSLTPEQLAALARRVQDAVERRIERTSAAAGTEGTLKPLVRETKSALRAVDERGDPA